MTDYSSSIPHFLVLDIDGVLTDGTDQVSGGDKRIYLRDIDALTRLRKQGVPIAYLTGEDGRDAEMIVERCGGGHAVYGAKDKQEGMHRLAKILDARLSDICYIGDADRDVAAMNLVGIALAPADASPRARDAADHVLRSCGGRGAVEEAVICVFEGYERGDR